jgi:hypothetical protein
MCDHTLQKCHSPFTAEFVAIRLLKFIKMVAAQHGLSYTLACDSLRYVMERPATRMWFAAVAVPPSEAVAWKQLLAGYNWKLTTYVLEHHSDGSIAHIRYSKISDAHVAIYVLPPQVPQLVTSEVKLHFTKVMSIANATNQELSALYSLCSSCVVCRPMDLGSPQQRTVFVQNVNLQTCLTYTPFGVELWPCSSKVGETRILGCVLLLTFVFAERTARQDWRSIRQHVL